MPHWITISAGYSFILWGDMAISNQLTTLGKAPEIPMFIDNNIHFRPPMRERSFFSSDPSKIDYFDYGKMWNEEVLHGPTNWTNHIWWDGETIPSGVYFPSVSLRVLILWIHLVQKGIAIGAIRENPQEMVLLKKISILDTRMSE